MLNLIVQNSGGTEAKDLRVALDGGDKVFPARGGKTRSITALSPGEVATVEYLLSSRGELSHHPLNISFDFFDPAGNELKSSERIFISSDLEPSLKIAGFNAQPKDDEGKFLFNLQLQNKGHSLARDISIRFTGTQAFPLEGSNLVSVANLAAGATTQLSVMMKAGTESEVYSLPVEIGYRSAGGAEHKTSETIVLTAASIRVDAPGQKQSTPRVMLKRHALSTNQVLAGGTFTLTLHIKNNAARAVGNMKISLGNIQVGGGAAGGAGAGGTVFSTLDGSSSSFFVDSIAANGRMIKEIALFVDPNATAMTYSLPITIEYEDTEGKAFSVSEAVNIPVLQESGIRVLALNIPSVAVLGQPVPLSMEFANTGRVALSNLLVVIEGDFPKENATYFIPRLDIGVSDFFQGMIIPASEGDLSGNLVITFLDSRHQEVRIDHPFTMEVQAMQELPMEIPEAEPPIAGGFPAIFRIVLGIGGSAFLLVSLFLLKRKMAKRRQAFFEEKI
ncbi:MAG: hypothetical protein DDT32_01822 [Syntrophomonadaceae bacterium]|nr:hypothetical protein [Bacillota bacterium]